MDDISILGGEPLISPRLFDFLDKISQQSQHINLQIVTNLSLRNNLKRLFEYRPKFKDIVLTVSIDGAGKGAELNRYGLNWQVFNENVNMVLSEYNASIRFTGTIAITSLDTLVHTLVWYESLSKRFGDQVSYSASICYNPTFQHIGILPSALKKKYTYDISEWMNKTALDDPLLMVNLKQIIALLAVDIMDNTHTEECDDFVRFIIAFCDRRNIQLGEYISDDLYQWTQYRNRM